MIANLNAISALAEHGWNDMTPIEAGRVISEQGISLSEITWRLEYIMASAQSRRNLAAFDREIESLPPISALFERAA